MYQIGVFGSGRGDEPEELAAMARELGEALAARGCIVVTGACSGLPYQAARAAAARGAEV
jgi:predicted Rossmann-fold nucleotide-binding protein